VRKWGVLAVSAALLAAAAFFAVDRQFDERTLTVGAWEYFMRDPDSAEAKRRSRTPRPRASAP